MFQPRIVAAGVMTFPLTLALMLLAAAGVFVPPADHAAAAPTTIYAGPGGGSGGCASPSFLTIQDAVDASATGGTVHICAGIYNLAATVAVGAKDLTFEGDGAGTTVVDGGGNVQLFNAEGQTITVSGLALRGGNATYGGAIAASAVHVTNSSFTGNSAGSPPMGGGAIYSSGDLTVTNSVFIGNSGSDRGGAILAGDSRVAIPDSCNPFFGYRNPPCNTVSITGSTFTGNTGDYGGALYANLGQTVTVVNSTFTDNVGAGGGALIVERNAIVVASTFSRNRAVNFAGGAITVGVTLSVTNSTFSENVAGMMGGAVHSAEALTVTNSTFSDNDAPLGASISDAYGGVTIANSIISHTAPGIANCYSQHAPAPFPYSSPVNGGGNFSTDASCGVTTVTTPPGDLALSSLASNGGPTQTIALLPGSVAIDAALNAVCIAAPVNGLDQRGVSRLQGIACDSGSYESAGPPLSLATLIQSIPALSTGQQNSLTNKLEQAATQYLAGHVNAACGQVGAFINQVNGLMPSSIQPATATILLNGANALKAAYGCS